MVITQHALECRQIKLRVILCEFPEGDRSILIDYSSDLHNCSLSELLGVSLELYDFNLGVLDQN